MNLRHIWRKHPSAPSPLKALRMEEWTAAYNAAVLAGALLFENGDKEPRRPLVTEWHEDEDVNWERATRYGMWAGFAEAQRTREMVVRCELERGMQQISDFLRAS